MKIKQSEFPKQPGTLLCCRECNGLAKKDCQPNPMNCVDFYMGNKEFIENKIRERSGYHDQTFVYGRLALKGD